MMTSSATPGMLRKIWTYRSPTNRNGLSGEMRMTVMATESTITNANDTAVIHQVVTRPVRYS